MSCGSSSLPHQIAGAGRASQTAEADRRRHPGLPRFNVLAGGPGSLAIWDETGWPMARLKKHPNGEFEVQRWCERGRWQTVFGGWRSGLPLEEALELVDRNVCGLFR